MRMRDRDVEMSIAQAEEEETREGSEECVLIFCKQCSDSPPLPRQTHGRFPIQSQKLERSILSGFIWIVTFQGVHQWSLIQVNKWDRFMLQTHTHTHQLLTGCPPLFPVTTHSLLFRSLAHTNHSRREAVCHGCTAEEMLCINLFRR